MRVAHEPQLAGWRLAQVVLLVSIVAGAAACSAERPTFPWTEERPRRVAIALDGIGWATGRIPVVVPLSPGPGNPASIRVSEVDPAGNVLDAAAPFQYDLDSDGGDGGELTLMIGGDAESTPRRIYVVYFDDGGKYSPTPVGPRVEVTFEPDHEGQESLRIKTGSGIWHYHLRGAGFASLVDHEGNDWLNYHPDGGAGGEYRGIPNLVYPEGYFHPGGTECTTRRVTEGPLRVVLDSECGDGEWAVRWEIFRLYARLTVLRVGHPYWFLYEGTPGGSLDDEGDFYALSDGTRFAVGDPRDDDLPEPEWVYFGDTAAQRVLWLAHDADDEHPDAYYPMEGQMTVFGFGRRRVRAFLTRVPTRFLVGLADSTDHAKIAGIVESALTRPDIEVAAVEERP